MKATLTPILAAVAALVGAAAEIHAIGAVRPEHAERFSTFRTGLDQIRDQVADAVKAAEEATPLPPGSVEFTQLRDQVATACLTIDSVNVAVAAIGTVAQTTGELRQALETMAMTVDRMGDQVADLVELANTPQEG
ncbi:hypothetical protein [Roseateles violae]|uniref:Uncharacterized protein n=1 Tax=Roseateles violae TaxID=3058042 RepID=A0ABT8DTS1_9BURK|nr:hypothetical protein [Pelomonas sp. PFR6]MDN3921518.1 hypothetical protein [Pelomonas sp. PFR6]